jgi:Amino acid permease
MLAPPSCSFHNTTARYFYSLGREGLLPSALGRTHHKFKSPHIASIVQSVIAAIIIILFALLTGSNDPASQAYLQIYGLMAVMGAQADDVRAGGQAHQRRPVSVIRSVLVTWTGRSQASE